MKTVVAAKQTSPSSPNVKPRCAMRIARNSENWKNAEDTTISE